jgi:hypothetical protein
VSSVFSTPALHAAKNEKETAVSSNGIESHFNLANNIKPTQMLTESALLIEDHSE